MTETVERSCKIVSYESDIETEMKKYIEKIKPNTYIYKELHKTPSLIAFKLLTQGLDLKNVKLNLFICNK